MRYLQGKGHEVQIIDYKPDYVSTRYNLWRIGPRGKTRPLLIRLVFFALKAPGRLIENIGSGKRAFDRFKEQHMELTDRRYKSNTELKQDPPEADVYIAGSDQIWNTGYQNGRDPAFYLDFAPSGRRKISYAARFAMSEIPPEYRSFVKKMIDRMDHVSVRARAGLDVLESINIENGVHVLDPVFLLSRSTWDAMAAKKITDKYVLVYDLDNDPCIEAFVKRIAKERGLKIFAANNFSRTSYADSDFYASGPEMFLALIRDAEIVVGNSFHGLAFSLIFEKEFFVFGRQKKQAANLRIHDLLSLCGLNDRLISSETDLPDRATPIQYEKVRQVLEKKIHTSEAYLEEAVACKQ